MRLPGETLSATLAFGRFQSSANAILGPFEGGWTHNYNVSCLDATNYVMISDWQGSQRVFTISNGVYTGDGTSALSQTNTTDFLWQLTHGTRYWFDSQHGNRLGTITDRIGNTVTLSYATGNILTGVVDVAGRQLALFYNVSDDLTNVVDPIGRATSFGYDGQGRLASVSDSLGTRAQYVYGDSALTNAITQVTNGRGYADGFTYNTLGQCLSQTSALEKVQTFA